MLPYYSFLKVLTVLADLREYVLPNQPCTHIQNKEVCLQTKKKKKFQNVLIIKTNHFGKNSPLELTRKLLHIPRKRQRTTKKNPHRGASPPEHFPRCTVSDSLQRRTTEHLKQVSLTHCVVNLKNISQIK